MRTSRSKSTEGGTLQRGPRRSVAIGIAISIFAITSAIEIRAQADDNVARDEARNHFKAGVTLLQDPDGARIEEAYREFKTAFGLDPSPKILGNLAYCALKLERDDEAIAAYERYLREATDVDAGEKKQVEGDLLTLKSGLVHVDLVIEGAATMIIDRRVPTRGEPVVNGYGPTTGKITLGVRQGHHVMEVKVGDGAPETWQFDAMPGVRVEHTFAPKIAELDPAPARSDGSSRAVPIVITSLGIAMLAGGAVTGGLAFAGYKRVENDCPNGTCPAGFGLESQRATTTTFVRATDILLIGGGVVTATGLGWLLFSHKSQSPAAMALCTGAGCSATLRGSF